MRVRNTRPADAPRIVGVQRAAFPSMDPSDGHWDEDEIEAHLRQFPEGQFVAEDDEGRIVGSATTLRLPAEQALGPHTWEEATGDGYLTTHDPQGRVLYGADVCVDPRTQGKGVGSRLYQARRALARRLGVAGIVSGGRIPGYRKAADRMDPDRYVDEVIAGKRRDPVLSFQLSQGFEVLGLLRNYMRDPRSGHFAVHIAWWNAANRPRRVAPRRRRSGVPGATRKPEAGL